MENPQQDTPPDNDVPFNTFIGVLVSVCGNVLISVALNVQKLAHNKIQESQMAKYFANMDEPPRWISTGSQSNYSGSTFFPDDGYSSPRSSEDNPRSEEEELEHQKFIMAMAQEQTRSGDADYLKSKLWWLGISMMVLGEVGNFVAYGFAPASTIAPLGTTTLVSNVILAPLMLKEQFRKRDLLGVFLAVLGAAVVVLSSNSEETALSPDMIVEALTQTRAIIYFAITGVAIAGLSGLSPVYGTRSIMIDLGLVAIYGGYTVLCTKSVSSLLSLTFFKMFAYPVSYLLIATLVITAILQIKYLNKALQRFDSTEVIPTQFVLFTIAAIVGSAVLYHDFDDMSMDQTSRFMTGCAIEFLGVYLITSKRNKQAQALSIQADDTAVGFATPATNSASDNGVADEAIHVPELLPTVDETNEAQYHSRRNRRSIPPATHDALNSGRLSSTAFRASTVGVPDEWQANAPLPKRNAHKRRSSVFRGISLTSQLVDRLNEDPDPVLSTSNTGSKQPIHLPPSSPTWQQTFGFRTHRRGDSALGNLFSGLTGVNNNSNNGNQAGILPSAVSHHYQTQHQPLEADADAVEIDIPTASSLSSQRNSEDDRELLPIQHNPKRSSTRLVDIEEHAEYRG
ncbi:magnesium transporter NIPA-domain-containing protein [Dichotomocladium elegans]|nr:magnesium transporter NIPA-domain-containing protein [Dichotomocladium elegans]